MSTSLSPFRSLSLSTSVPRHLLPSHETSGSRGRLALPFLLAILIAIGAARPALAQPEIQFEPTAYAHADARVFVDDEDDEFNSTFLLRRVRPSLRAKFLEHYAFRAMIDVAGGTVQVLDVYLDIAHLPEATLRIGKAKSPVGLERLQSATSLTFIERAFPTLLVPNRDIGVQVIGDISKGLFTYAVGGFNGVSDGASLDQNDDDNFELVARVFSHPFAGSDNPYLRGLGLGVAGSVGTREGSTASPGVSSFRTSGGLRFFQYAPGNATTPGVVADGRQARVSAQGYYYGGPVGLLGEYVFSQQTLSLGDVSGRVANQAWQVAGSVVLTGESPSYKGLVPAQPFDLTAGPAAGQWGAVELAGRFSELRFDEDIFSLSLSAADTSARKAQAWAVGANWYLNQHVKLQLNFEQTRFRYVSPEGGRPAENVILVRTQLSI
jgi:phosphate-selective porin OprO/OprP